MKTILCYGDSNTWGYNPKGGRYDHTIRWPRVMAASLGNSYWVVEEGLNGRTTCREDPIEGDRNGLRQLIPIIRSHRPLDLIIIMLGTNDLKYRFNQSPFEVSQGALLVAKAALGSGCGPEDGQPKVLLVCPAPFVKSEAFMHIFASDAVEISQKLAPHYQVCAKECGAEFFDAGSVVRACSPVDGIHWEAEDQINFGRAMAEQVQKLL